MEQNYVTVTLCIANVGSYSTQPRDRGPHSYNIRSVRSTWTELNWSSRTPVWTAALWNACVQNSPSTNRPSFAAVNPVVTLTRVTNKWRRNWVDSLQVSSVQFRCCEKNLYFFSLSLSAVRRCHSENVVADSDARNCPEGLSKVILEQDASQGRILMWRRPVGNIVDRRRNIGRNSPSFDRTGVAYTYTSPQKLPLLGGYLDKRTVLCVHLSL